MGNVVWKYTIENIDNRGYLEMPKGADILTVQLQKEKVVMWVLVDPNIEKETRYFHFLYTGVKFRKKEKHEYKYIDTVQKWDGDLVIHVFEIIGVDNE
jgi:hypothetical protein